MHQELSDLGRAICRPRAGEPLDTARARAEAPSVTVVIPAGGFGYRMRDVAQEAGGVTQKSLLPLPNGETLIDRVVRQYAACGFREFVALVNHEGADVERHLGDGSRWGVRVRCSYDPEGGGSGRTGAMLHAVRRGALPADRRMVVHNADCHVFGYAGSFPDELLALHLASANEGAIATLAAVEGTPYPFTGMSIREGRVSAVEMYPFIPVPTHTGITLLEPEALTIIEERAGRTLKNFEADLFPEWARAGRLAAMVLPYDHWVAVDDRKSYQRFREALAASGDR